MASLDEGLATFRAQWKAKHPGATVYWIADSNHSQNPRTSQHAQDDGKSGGPGDTVGEVDAVDVMPGGGVTAADLAELWAGLIRERDSRVLYLIHRDKIVSSVVQPWKIRDYSGPYHTHVHISVNDNFKANTSEWGWELAEQKWNYVEIPGARLPKELAFGMEDAAFEGYNHISRAQALLNYQERKSPLDVDGVYGANTKAKVARVFGGNGRTLDQANLRKLWGI